MQTEIQFLIDLILNHKLGPEVRKLMVARIGEVEAQLNVSRSQAVAPKLAPLIPQQAPSTQAILERDVIVPTPAMPPIQRIVGGEVQTGQGTRGPRKF